MLRHECKFAWIGYAWAISETLVSGKGAIRAAHRYRSGIPGYFMVEGKSAVVLFRGGDKATRQEDIHRARECLRDYGGGQMSRSASYDDLLMDMLKDEERALAYLNAALDERDPRVS